MRTQTRRRVDAVALGLGALAGSALVVIGGVVGDTERVARMWVGARVAGEGSTAVIEVIDYDFGTATGRHGIFRDIPGLSVESPVQVQSDTAPDGIAERTPVFTTGSQGSQIKIGDPSTTVSGRHRYRIDYALPRTELLPGGDDGLDWDAVGTAWTVRIARAEVHVVAPWRLERATCSTGREGATGGCTLRAVEPGHLVVIVEDLAKGEGVTVTAARGTALPSTPALPAPPTSAPPDPGAGLALPAGAALISGLGASIVSSTVVRRSGRERVGIGGAADAAWAGGGAPVGEVRMDEHELASMATTEFAPPSELTPAQGGVLYAESVQPGAKVAWLIQAAIDDHIELIDEGGKAVQLVQRGELGAPELAPLASAFAGRSTIQLGTFDKQFARGWSELGDQLSSWRVASGLWDPRAEHHMAAARSLGALAMVLGGLLAFGGSYAAATQGRGWIPAVIVGSLISGGGFAAVLRGWELRVRTPEGSGLWLRVESFRRFLHESETFHAEEAAKRGVLREYTAWAVALGEIDRWQHAVDGSTAIPAESGLGYVHMAPILIASTSSTSTAPSSSGGSGGGGGSVGGGGGGGGGGSW